jgi:YegS/Rv2252/BmrU family lipid kinase
VGGDGTINEVISGMMKCGARAKIGIVPSGSGNDLIKPLLISPELEKSVSTIIKGTTKKIDVGRCNERYFMNIMGVGFDAAVGARMHQLRCKAKTKKGKSFYSKALFHTIMHYKSIPLKVEIDGKKYHKKFFLVSIANGTTFGGDFVIAPMADICDGSLCLVSIESISKIRFFMHLNKVKKGRILKLPEVDYEKCKKLTIRSTVEIVAQLDGEYYCAKKFDISVIPAGLEVFVPVIK